MPLLACDLHLQPQASTLVIAVVTGIISIIIVVVVVVDIRFVDLHLQLRGSLAGRAWQLGADSARYETRAFGTQSPHHCLQNFMGFRFFWMKFFPDVTGLCHGAMHLQIILVVFNLLVGAISLAFWFW